MLLPDTLGSACGPAAEPPGHFKRGRAKAGAPWRQHLAWEMAFGCSLLKLGEHVGFQDALPTFWSPRSLFSNVFSGVVVNLLAREGLAPSPPRLPVMPG